MTAKLEFDAKAQLGEGSIWDRRTALLYWVDILAGEVHRYDPKTGEDQFITTGQTVGTVVPRGRDDAVVGLRDGIYTVDFAFNTVTLRTHLEEEKERNRFNDGKCDPSGRFWVGSLNDDDHRAGLGALYRTDRGWKPVKILSGVSVSNGICWNSDRNVMYYTDTPTGEVSRFDYNDVTGEVRNRSVAVSVDETDGRPDGMTIDAEGNLWVAMWGGWKVCGYDPVRGKKIAEVRVPAEKVSSCAFGGDDLGDLFITCAREGLSEDDLTDQPHAGGLFRARPGVVGVEADYCTF